MQRRQGMCLMLAALAIAVSMLCSTQVMALQVGDKAPDFSLPATTTETVSLADFMGKKPVVVFFYVGAFTNT